MSTYVTPPAYSSPPMKPLCCKNGMVDTHPQELSNLAARARKRIREHYTWEKFTDDHERLFDELKDGRHPWGLWQAIK